jgi:hypothetical protein
VSDIWIVKVKRVETETAVFSISLPVDGYNRLPYSSEDVHNLCWNYGKLIHDAETENEYIFDVLSSAAYDQRDKI